MCMVTTIDTTYSWFVWHHDKRHILHIRLCSQMSNGYVKGNLTKHVAPKFFYPHELQKNGVIVVKKVRSSDNLTDLLTKSLHTSTFEKYVHGIGMRRL